MEAMHETELEEVASWIRESRYTVALTGAGISTESGIPDFRGPQGVWTKDPKAERMSHISYYLSDPEVRAGRWQRHLESPYRHARPNAGHLALVDLEREGHLDLLVTQNIDRLHLEAGSSEAIVVEVHGNNREVACLGCGERAPMERALDRVRAGEADPPCRSCGGILKSATISFGQQLVPEDLDRAFKGASSSEVMLALGTLLSVYPVAHMADYALQSGARLVIVNAEATPYDRQADAVIRGNTGEVIPRLVELV